MNHHTYTSHCKYHQHKHSSWSCSNCDMTLCDTCVPHGHSKLWGSNGPRCPLCNKDLEFLGSNEEIPAFWTLLPHFFSYPLHSNSLKVIGLITVASVLLGYLGILAFIIGLFLLSLTVKYSFLIIEKCAVNETIPPSLDQFFDRDEHHLFLKLIAVMVILYGSVAYFGGEESSLAVVLYGFITFVLPAMTIILAIEKTIAATLNPLIILSFILRVGWAYLLVWLCYQIVVSGPTSIFSLVEDSLPIFISIPIIVAMSLYFWFVANCMLGYIVYQYQDSLGHTEAIIPQEDIDVSKDAFLKKKVLAEANIHMMESSASQARKLIRPMLDQYKNDKELHSFYHKILAIVEDEEALKNHADFFITLLVDDGDKNLAATVYQQTTDKIPNYRTQNADTAYLIAQTLHMRGQNKLIPKLLNNLHKRDPKLQNLPDAYLLLAKVYSEHLGNDNQANKILDFLLDNFPRTPIRKNIVDFKKLLENKL